MNTNVFVFCVFNIKKCSQHIFPEAPFPLGLVEKVIEMATKRDENEAKGQEPKNAWLEVQKPISGVEEQGNRN